MESVNVKLSQCLANRLDTVAAAVGLSRNELK